MDEQNEFKKDSTSFGIVKPVNESIPDIQIPTVRTFKNDISQTVKKDNVTSAKILMAEQKIRNNTEETNTENTKQNIKNTFSVLIGIILLVLSIGAIAYFGYTRVTNQPLTTAPQGDSFLFVFDNEKFIDSSQPINQLENQLEQYKAEVAQKANNIYTEIIFYKKDSETNTQERVTSIEFFKIFEMPLVINVARAISQEFTYGFYTTDGRSEPFLVVGLVDYENAYSSMLSWESTLALDIKPIFPVLKDLFDILKIVGIPQPVIEENSSSTGASKIVGTNLNSTTTATTTPKVTTGASTTQPASSTQDELNLTPEQEQQTVQNINRSIRFTDVVLSNYNTRAVRNENGSPFFYYAFIGKEKILFAQDPKLIGEIIRKMKERQLVR